MIKAERSLSGALSVCRKSPFHDSLFMKNIFLPERSRRHADRFGELRVEMARIVVSDLRGDARHRQLGRDEQRLCLADADRNAFLLKNMEGKEDRACRFVCAIACVLADGETVTVRGECEGELLHENHGAGGFGYDPLFYVPEYECTFGELAPEVKNRISHRARALGRLRDVLKDKI